MSDAGDKGAAMEAHQGEGISCLFPHASRPSRVIFLKNMVAAQVADSKSEEEEFRQLRRSCTIL